MARRSFWAWGMEDQQPSQEQYAAMGQRLFDRYGATVELFQTTNRCRPEPA